MRMLVADDDLEEMIDLQFRTISTRRCLAAW
jgi:hypothetical protein